MDSKNKVIFITGASSGFGRLAAIEFLKRGYTVYGAARNVKKMADLKAMGARIMALDVTYEKGVNAACKKIISDCGKIDVLLNNAGYGGFGMFESVPMEEARHQFEVNVFGAANVLRAVLPYMREKRQGVIINMSSIVGKITPPMTGWYSASKRAVEALSDAIRMETEGFGIKVFVIEPGIKDTGFFQVAKEKMESFINPLDYMFNAEAFKKHMISYYNMAGSPKPVVDAILMCALGETEKTHIPVGVDSGIGILASKILGTKFNDYAYKLVFGLKY